MRILGVGTPSWNDVIKEFDNLLGSSGQFFILRQKKETHKLFGQLRQLLKDATYIYWNRALGQKDDDRMWGIIKETKRALREAK